MVLNKKTLLHLWQSSVYLPELFKLNKIFKKNKIDFLFLKGLPLHLYFEKKIPNRIYCDCDLLINPKDFNKTKKILINLNYQMQETSLTFIQKKFQKQRPEYIFFKKINNFPVLLDIHTEAVFMMTQLGKLNHLYPHKKVEDLTQNFLENKRFVKLKQQILPILSQENLILYLALHFFHHNFLGKFRLEFLKKIIKKTSKEEILSLTKKVKKYKLENFVYPGLYLANFSQTFLNSIKPSKRILNYLKNKIISQKINQKETRIQAGINRFRNLFFLSPQATLSKLLTFFDPKILFLIFWSASKFFALRLKAKLSKA